MCPSEGTCFRGSNSGWYFSDVAFVIFAPCLLNKANITLFYHRKEWQFYSLFGMCFEKCCIHQCLETSYIICLRILRNKSPLAVSPGYPNTDLDPIENLWIERECKTRRDDRPRPNIAPWMGPRAGHEALPPSALMYDWIYKNALIPSV